MGTIVKDESEKKICEVTHEGEEFTIVKGGMGGRGNSHFKSSTMSSQVWFLYSSLSETFLNPDSVFILPRRNILFL